MLESLFGKASKAFGNRKVRSFTISAGEVFIITAVVCAVQEFFKKLRERAERRKT